MIRKEYSAPEAEAFEVRLEAHILSPEFNGDNNQKPDDGGEDDF